MPRKSAAASEFGTAHRGKPLDAPDYLNEAQACEWKLIVDSMPADYFLAGDVPLLTAFVIASAIYKQAAKQVADEGLTVTDDRGRPYANPLCQVMASQASSMSTLSTKLRLCQSARYTTTAAATKVNASKGGVRPWQQEHPEAVARETAIG
jgi:P27 family predicted phage terminase small subunit